MTKPTLVFINRIYPPVQGATGLMLRDLAQHCSENGYAVTVLTTGDRDETVTDKQVRVIRINAPQKRNTYNTYKMHRKLLQAGKKIRHADCVITLTDPPLLARIGDKIARSLKAKHIHWSHDVYPETAERLKIAPPSTLLRHAVKHHDHALNKCRSVVAIGTHMKKHYENRIVDTPMHIIPNWFPIRRSHKPAFNTLSSDPNLKQSALQDIPKFRILYTGRMGRSHPHKTIFKAVHKLYKTDPDIEFVFIGDENGVLEKIKHFGKPMPPSFRILPYQPDTSFHTLLKSGDVHISSLDMKMGSYAVPSKFFASLAVERPSIFVGPNNNDVADIINTYKCGKVIPQGKVDTLIKTIRAYRHDETAWFDARYGAQKAAKVYNRDASLKLWLDLLGQTLKT